MSRLLLVATLALAACGGTPQPEHCSSQPACVANPTGSFLALVPRGIVLVPCECGGAP